MNSPEYELPVKRIEAFAIPKFPYVRQGDDVGKLIYDTLGTSKVSLANQDIVVIAQKIISRAEGRIRLLKDVQVSDEARSISGITGKDPRICQLIVEDSSQVLYANERALITEHISGLVSGSSGLDTTNVGEGLEEAAILLPVNSDESAKNIRKQLMVLSGKQIAVIITDSIGRPFRKGSVGMSIGFSGISALERVRKEDLFGKSVYQEVALVDEISAMASPLMGEANEGNPVIIVRGVHYTVETNDGLNNLVRPPEEDQIWP